MNHENLMHGRVWGGQSVIGWLAQEKLDGWRALWTGTQLVTRAGTSYDAPEWFVDGLPVSAPLDCELVAANGVSSAARVASLVRRNAWHLLRLAIIDAPGDQPFALRIRSAEKHLTRWTRTVETWPVRSVAKLDGALRTIQARGGEGIIVRRPDAPYESGRVSSLLKLKRPPSRVERFPVSARAVFAARTNCAIRHPWRRGFPNNARLDAAVASVFPPGNSTHPSTTHEHTAPSGETDG